MHRSQNVDAWYTLPPFRTVKSVVFAVYSKLYFTIHPFCTQLVHKYEVKNKNGVDTTTIVIGEIVMFHILEGALDTSAGEGKPTVRLDRLRPMARFGGNTYGLVTDAFDLPRPDRKI